MSKKWALLYSEDSGFADVYLILTKTDSMTLFNLMGLISTIALAYPSLYY